MSHSIQQRTIRTNGVDLVVTEAGDPTGPCVILSHGFPESAHSWRHQIQPLADAGYHVLAPDQRGYGFSSSPKNVTDYGVQHLTGDLVGLLDATGHADATFVGHDWGAPIVWNTSILHPDHIRAVAGLSVPFTGISETSFLDIAEMLYQGKFFYQLYFQAEGVAEAEFEADVAASLRKTYFSISGDAPLNHFLENKPVDAKFFDGMVDPEVFPRWLTEADLQVFIDAFTASGFRGPFNRYRAQRIDAIEMAEHIGSLITQPSFFIGGEKDAVRSFVPGMDLYENPLSGGSDVRGSVIIPNVGHWVQQEAPRETNIALEGFLSQLK